MIDVGGARAYGGSPGRTTISARALRRLATAVVGETARVPSREVSVDLFDDGGALRAAVVVPVALGAGGGSPLTNRAERVRGAVIDGLGGLAGRHVAAVDVRFAGVHRGRKERVR